MVLVVPCPVLPHPHPVPWTSTVTVGNIKVILAICHNALGITLSRVASRIHGDVYIPYCGNLPYVC
jgi:hypothetical protein